MDVLDVVNQIFGILWDHLKSQLQIDYIVPYLKDLGADATADKIGVGLQLLQE